MGETRIIEAKATAQVLCVVVHGRGQTQDDMMASIVQHLDVPEARFVLPKSKGPGWYAARAIDALTPDSRAELAESLDALALAVEEGRAGMGMKPTMFVGFSQGACLSVEYLMREGPIFQAAALLTSCRVGHRMDDLPITDMGGMPIYASCGDNDPWIPATAYHEMLGDLTRAKARLRTDMFPGRGHEVSAVECGVLQGMLTDIVAGRALFGGAW